MANSNINFLHLDEKNHVEEPFLKQLESMPGIHWNVLRLEMGAGQTPQQTQRENFTQVIMRYNLETALKKINPWLSEQQVFEAVSDLTTFDSDNLYKNNQKVLNLLINGTKVQHQTPQGLRYEPVHYIDFQNASNNNFEFHLLILYLTNQ